MNNFLNAPTLCGISLDNQVRICAMRKEQKHLDPLPIIQMITEHAGPEFRFSQAHLTFRGSCFRRDLKDVGFWKARPFVHHCEVV